MKQKTVYQFLQIEILDISVEDVIRTSGFNGEDDDFSMKNEI